MNSCALFSILKSLLVLIPVVLNLAAQKNHLENFFKNADSRTPPQTN